MFNSYSTIRRGLATIDELSKLQSYRCYNIGSSSDIYTAFRILYITNKAPYCSVNLIRLPVCLSPDCSDQCFDVYVCFHQRYAEKATCKSLDSEEANQVLSKYYLKFAPFLASIYMAAHHHHVSHHITNKINKWLIATLHKTNIALRIRLPPTIFVLLSSMQLLHRDYI